MPAAHHAQHERATLRLVLQPGHELARVPGRAAHVVRARDDERRRIERVRADVVVRRVGAEHRRVGRVVGVAVLAQAGLAVGAQVVAQHVGDGDERARRAPEVGPLRHGDGDHQAAVRAAEDGDARRIGDPPRGDVLRDRVEVVVGMLLPLERSVAVEVRPLLAAAADVAEHEGGARLDEVGIRGERPARERDVPAAVGVEDGGQAHRLEIRAVDDLVADRRAVGRGRLVARDDEREAAPPAA